MNNSVIADLEMVLATHAADTLPHRFARAKLAAVQGDIATAGQALHSLMQEQPDNASKWEHSVFAYVVHIGLLTLQLEWVSDAVNDRLGTRGWFNLELEERAPGDISTFRWRIESPSRSVLLMGRQLLNSDRFDFYVTRFIYMLPIQASYLAQAEREVGELLINYEDHGVRPGLAFCDNRSNYFLVPDCEYLHTRGYQDVRRYFAANDIPWTQRQPVAHWRGATTGRSDPSIGWRSLPRVKLCELALAHSDLIDAAISRIVQVDARSEQEIQTTGIVRDFVPVTEFNKYRYQIDIDGNTNSWPGLFQKLLTGSPVLKVASPFGFRQWYYDRLKPWINFVPVGTDMSDLVDKVRWLREHDDAARAIGERGQALALSMDYEGELQRACRTVSAALRYFSGRPETELRLGVGEPGNARLQDGWFEPEEGGVAARGFESRLKLPRPVAAEDFVLSLDISPVTEPPATTPQRVVVVANGEVLLESKLAERQILHCALLRRTIEMDEALSVTLLHPDARISASATHPLDGRTASVVLHGVSLTAACVHAAQHLPGTPIGPDGDQSAPPAA